MKYIHRLRAVKPLRWAGWASLPLFPLFCCMVLEYYNAGDLAALAAFWRLHTSQAVFGLLVSCVLFALVLLLVRRAAVACALTGGASLLIAFVHSMKLALNGDPFFPKDVFMAG